MTDLRESEVEQMARRVAELERMLARVLPYVHAEPHAEHSALHDEASALLNGERSAGVPA